MHRLTFSALESLNYVLLKSFVHFDPRMMLKFTYPAVAGSWKIISRYDQFIGHPLADLSVIFSLKSIFVIPPLATLPSLLSIGVFEMPLCRTFPSHYLPYLYNVVQHFQIPIFSVSSLPKTCYTMSLSYYLGIKSRKSSLTFWVLLQYSSSVHCLHLIVFIQVV